MERENAYLTYRYVEEKSVYIMDLYVRPEFRKTGIAKALADEVRDMALKRGCTKMLGSVVPSNKDSTISVSVLIAYGMKLKSSSNDFIIFEKDI
jgi:GNAT superfamily N-acetyltransferase